MSNVKLARKMIDLAQVDDPKQGLLSEIGNAVEQFELLNDDVLIATYVPKENKRDGNIVSAGGILLPQKKSEDQVVEHMFQGKVGLILKKGPIAFQYDRAGCEFKGRVPEDHEWVLFRPSDGWSVSFNQVSCRIISSTMIRGVVGNPSVIW